MGKGLLDFGMSEEAGATKGLVEADKLESEIDMQNLSLQTQSDIQHKQLGVETAMAGGVAGYVAGSAMSGAAAAAFGAEAGAWAGPVGMVAGAALGFLVSKLF